MNHVSTAPPTSEKNPAALASAPGSGKSRHAHHTKLPIKKNRIIAELLERGERGLNRFEAAQLHDSVLNSTIAQIQRDGITIARSFENVPGYAGSQVTCCRYRLVDPDARRRAAELLGLGSTT